MTILILEDDPARQKWFNRLHGEVVIVDTVEEFNGELRRLLLSHKEHMEGEVTQSVLKGIFLDHDLGGQIYQESDSNSGFGAVENLVKAVKDMEIYSIIESIPIVVHSCNPAGAQKMVDFLKLNTVGVLEVYRTPFPSLKDMGTDGINRMLRL